MKMHKAMQNVV